MGTQTAARWIALSIVSSLACGAAVAEPERTSARVSSPIKSDEEVILFPTAAAREGQSWIVPIHGWIYEPEEDSLWRRPLVKTIAEALDVEEGSPHDTTFRERVRWFLVDNERDKRIPVALAGQTSLSERSQANGHFRGQIVLAGQSHKKPLQLQAITRDGDRRRFIGSVHFVEPEGLSVVSDIDDTIKITEVKDRKRTLERTFLLPFEPVPGMAALYRELETKRSSTSFHYVSGSPWHLYPELSRFMSAERFPAGTFHLRDFRVKDTSRFNLLEPAREHKLATIGDLLRRYPRRQFVLIGDSSELDPEIYGEIARRHPGRIDSIWIREVHPGEMDVLRRRQAFRNAKVKTYVFAQPSELGDLASLR